MHVCVHMIHHNQCVHGVCCVYVLMSRMQMHAIASCAKNSPILFRRRIEEEEEEKGGNWREGGKGKGWGIGEWVVWKGVAMATGMFKGPSLLACLPAKPG